MDARPIKTNLYAFFRMLGKSSKAEYQEKDGLVFWHTDLPHPWFSGILGTRPTDGRSPEIVEEVLKYFRDRGVSSFTWWLEPDVESDGWSQQLLPHGFQYLQSPPGMAIDLAKLPEDVDYPAALTIRPVEDLETLPTWAATFTRGYGLPDSFRLPIEELFGSMGVDLPLRHYLGYLDGEAVASSTLLLADGVAGIYDVGTVPEARRQGIGAIMTLKPLQDACEMGYQTGILQSSDMGFGVYQRLGFEHLCDVDHFYWEAGE